MSEFKYELPKGMILPEVVPVQVSVPFNLGCSNYVQVIYHALEILPIKVHIEKCIVLEKHGELPMLKLTLCILGEREEEVERRGTEISG